jgi:muramoyltetrapeptide carboxypeptidase
MTKIPPYLLAGDSIGMVCPSGYMSLEKAQAAIDRFQEWGYPVITGKTVGSASGNYFSGTDRERLADFQQMLDNDAVKAVFCARGGYGVGRIIDRIDFKKFKKTPKWVVGFSDVSILHAHIYAQYRIAGLHAPMASAFTQGESENPFVESLKNALEGRKAKYHCDPHEFNKKGEAVGEVTGGNLSLLVHLIGTASDCKTKGRILFLEDVGEYLYHLDRMMLQLKRAGKLDRLAGLIIGGFTETKDTERPYGQTAYQIIRDMVRGYDYPVCYGFPVGHQRENLALKIGVGYKLRVGKSRTTLEE